MHLSASMVIATVSTTWKLYPSPNRSADSLTDVVIFGGVRDVQQPPDLLLPDVRPGAARAQGGVGELQVVHRLVVLQRGDQVVAVELSGVVAQGAQRQTVLG